MPRYEDRPANRFWEIEQEDRVVYTRWGLIGGKAQEHTRREATVEAAETYVAAQSARQVARGYRRVRVPDPTAIAPLEANLVAHPDDLAAALVYADVLLASDDPMGEMIALQCALATCEDPAQARQYELRLRGLLTNHYNYLYGRAGGFPFRRAWWGRDWIRYAPPDPQRLRGKTGPPLYDRVQKFLTSCTDAGGPDLVQVEWVGNEAWREGLPPTLGAGHWVGDGVWRRVPGLDQPDPALFFEHLAKIDATGAHMTWHFRLTWPGDDVLLPYQHEVFHHGWALPPCRLRLELSDPARLGLHLAFPFQDFDDPRFVAVREALTDSLGKVLARRPWYHCTLKKDRRGYKETRVGLPT